MRTVPSCVAQRARLFMHVQDFTWNISTYDGVITDKVIRLRGVYSSSDIPSGTAVAFIPSSHLLHLSQFNRSKIWASLEKLPTPPNTNNVRILQTSVGEFLCLSRARRTLHVANHAFPLSCCLRAEQSSIMVAAPLVRHPAPHFPECHSRLTPSHVQPALDV